MGVSKQLTKGQPVGPCGTERQAGHKWLLPTRVISDISKSGLLKPFYQLAHFFLSFLFMLKSEKACNIYTGPTSNESCLNLVLRKTGQGCCVACHTACTDYSGSCTGCRLGISTRHRISMEQRGAASGGAVLSSNAEWAHGACSAASES